MSHEIHVHVPIRLEFEGDDVSEVRAGAFATREEAENVLEYWREAGHRSPMGVRTLPVWGTAADWIAAGAVPASGDPAVIARSSG